MLRLNASEHGGEIALREKDCGLWKPTTWEQYHARTRDFALGLIEVLSVALSGQSSLRDAIAFACLFLFLVVRPTGIFGSRGGRAD